MDFPREGNDTEGKEVKSSFDAGGCFPTGRHYPGIAHLIRISVEGLATEWEIGADIREIPWVSIDTETTGRDPVTDRIVEVGCVFLRGGQVVDRKGWLINPERPIPEEASSVHGIFDADVADQPIFQQVGAEILSSLAGYLPLAYNAEFDREFLRAEVARTGGESELLPPAMRPEVTWIDPLDWARELQSEHKSRALGDVCERLGIQLENAHRATDDAEAAGRVMAAFVKDNRVPHSYGAFIKEQRRIGRLFEFERVRWR
jgi:DNA polymerase III subunit epsilon